MSMARIGSSATAPRVGITAHGLLLRWGSLLVIVLILLAWQAITTLLAVPIYILPQPSVLLMAFVTNAATLGRGWGVTMLEAAAGFTIGNVLSIVVAFLITWSTTIRAAVMPVAVAIKSIPMVAITPLITLSVGFGSTTVIAVAAIVCFFPTLVNVSRGLKAAPRSSVELMRILNASELQTFFKVRLPFALPYLFTALRITAPAAIGAAMLAEYVASNAGLGYLIQDSYSQFRFILVWQIVIVATLTTLGAFLAVTRTEHAVLSRRGRP